MMNGIEDRPAAVGSHLDTNAGKKVVLATAILEDRTITAAAE